MKQTFIKSAMLLLLILSTATTRAQEVALKTNLLGWAASCRKLWRAGTMKAGM